jgi:hypothetical protein
MPTFSKPTEITNPLFPISGVQSAILSGRVDGKDFRTETTLLPWTEFLEGPDGTQVETLVSQYVAYLDGRIEEVALDHYAQADDGSVWYFGEYVFNFEDGVIVDTAGTSFAGVDGPAAMIMPADPQVGDVYRSENVPGVVFEEVRIASVDETVTGPHGPVEGALIASELHADGAREDKTFAPDYGEFFTGSGGDVEAMTLAVPADALSAPIPAELETLSHGADDVFDSAPIGRLGAGEGLAAGDVSRLGGIPGGHGAPETRRADDHGTRRASHGGRQPQPRCCERRGRSGRPRELGSAAAASASGRDRPRPIRALGPPTRRRRQAGDEEGVRGDLITLELIRDRFVHTLNRVDAVRLEQRLLDLRTAVTDGDLRAAVVGAERLRALPGVAS